MAEDEQIPAKSPRIPATAKSRYPPGYRFMPTDRELIQEYLQKKINKEPIPAEINEVILKHLNPKELPAKYPKLGDNEWYFFTPRDRKYPNGERPDRGCDTGYWKATGADKLVQVGEETVGFRKALVFYQGKAQKGVKTNWIMHEFRVKEDKEETERKKETPKTMRLDDWVLCRMYEKTARLTNNRRNNTDNRSERESPSSGGESSQTVDAGESVVVAVTNPNPNPNNLSNNLNQGEEEDVMIDLPIVISDNPNPYSYYYSDPNIGELSLEDLVNPVNAFGNPYINEFGFHHQPYASTSSSWTNNDFQASSSSWINNHVQYSVPPNTTTNFSTFYSQTGTQQEEQDQKRFRYY